MGTSEKYPQLPPTWLAAKLELCKRLLQQLKNEVSIATEFSNTKQDAKTGEGTRDLRLCCDLPEKPECTCGLVRSLSTYPDSFRRITLSELIDLLIAAQGVLIQVVLHVHQQLRRSKHRQVRYLYDAHYDQVYSIVRDLWLFTEHLALNSLPTHPLWLDSVLDHILSEPLAELKAKHITSAPIYDFTNWDNEYVRLDFFDKLPVAVFRVWDSLVDLNRVARKKLGGAIIDAEIITQLSKLRRRLHGCNFFIQRVSWLSPCIAHLSSLSAHELGHYCFEKASIPASSKEIKRREANGQTWSKELSPEQIAFDWVNDHVGSCVPLSRECLRRIVPEGAKPTNDESFTDAPLSDVRAGFASAVPPQKLRNHLEEVFCDAFALKCFGTVSLVAFLEKVFPLNRELDGRIEFSALLDAWLEDRSCSLRPQDIGRPQRITECLVGTDLHPPPLLRIAFMIDFMQRREMNVELVESRLFRSLLYDNPLTIALALEYVTSGYEKAFSDEIKSIAFEDLAVIAQMIKGYRYMHDVVDRLFRCMIRRYKYTNVSLSKLEIDAAARSLVSSESSSEHFRTHKHRYALLLAASHRLHGRLAYKDWEFYMKVNGRIVDAAHGLRRSIYRED